LQSNPPIPARPDRLKAAIPATNTNNSNNQAHVGEANSSTETGPALQDDANAYPLQPYSNMTDTSESQHPAAVQPEVLDVTLESPADTGVGSSGWQGESDTDLGPKGKELAAESPVPPETMLGDIVGGVCVCGKINHPEFKRSQALQYLMRMRMRHNPVVRNNPPRQVPIGDIRTSDAYPAGDGDRAEGDAWAAQSIADSLNTYGTVPPADETDASVPTQGILTPPPPPSSSFLARTVCGSVMLKDIPYKLRQMVSNRYGLSGHPLDGRKPLKVSYSSIVTKDCMSHIRPIVQALTTMKPIKRRSSWHLLSLYDGL
jgi:hypothetical protein